MKKEFIPSEEALALKELGFDEPCFAYYVQEPYYNSKKELKFKRPTYYEISGWKNSDKLVSAKEDYCIYVTLPLYQQAFRWFRKEHNLCSWVYQSNSGLYHYSILKDDRYLSSGTNNEATYEEAELACLRKLTEIINKKLAQEQN